MSEKKHIDRLFQEKFKDFEVSPNENVWNNIENKLKGKKPRRRFLIPLWYKIAGSAAMLAFLIWMGGSIFDNEPKTNNTINIATPTDVENPNPETRNETSTTEKTEIQQKVILPTGAVVSTKNKENDKVEIPENNSPSRQEEGFISGKLASNPVGETNQNTSPNPENNTQKVISERKNNNISSEEVFSKNNSVEKTAQSEDEAVNKKSLLAYAEEQEAEKNKKFEEDELDNALSQNKWQIQTFAAPVYYGGGNAIDPKFASNPNESDITMAYGVNVAYQISDKIMIRSGIGQVKMSNNIQNVVFASAVEPMALRNVNHNSKAENLRIENFSTFSNSFPDGEVQGRPLPFSTGTLNQEMGFIEVPLEIEYALIDKKFGLSIIGGGSTLFLNENSISINSADGTTNIGEANNLNKTSFSTNIGLGMDYELSKRFELSLEPIFKYQLNTFSKDMDFNPYYFGVFTGISFKF